MMPGNELTTLLMVVTILSVVQSIFGVGLLVFGTPLLLLIGYPFETILSYLLPCSILISICQLINGRKEICELRFKLPFFVVPSVVIGLMVVLVIERNVNMRFAVGLMLIVTALTRASSSMRDILERLFRRYLRFALIMTGFVHGLTNMGGGLLTITVNSIYDKKQEIRSNIAYGYLLMAATQLLVLVAMKQFRVGIEIVILQAVSMLSYLLVGQLIYRKTDSRAYYHMMTILMLLFGINLIVFK